jgi:hypothetical protein
MNAKQFEQTLATLDGFKSIFSGLFSGGKAKSSFEIYRSAMKVENFFYWSCNVLYSGRGYCR